MKSALVSRAPRSGTHFTHDKDRLLVAYDQRQAARLRRALADRPDIEERHMFGGLAFMARGHMCCGLVQTRLMVRVGPDAYERLLKEPHARPMDFTGRPMRGFLYVEPAGAATATALRAWVGRALAFADSLPPKTKQKGKKRPARRQGFQRT